ncbi:MAG: hypothetical protein EOM66_07595 [Clostridia bacterium]|nr:hypothetical protein [Clostridia bacterium]
MLRQIRLLTSIQLCNLCGWNEFRYTKSPKKKWRWIGMAALSIVVGLMLLLYMGLFSWALINMGMSEVIPMYFYTLTCLVVLFFTIFKAGSVLFQMKSYEMMVALPVSKASIVISRFLSMYVVDLLMGFLFMLPGTILYGVFARPNVSFYLLSLLGTLFLPLLPMTVATALGAAITAVSARMKRKSLISAALTMLLVALLIVWSFMLPKQLENVSKEMVFNFSAMLNRQLASLYPPAVWYCNSVVSGNPIKLLLLIALSLALFAAVIWVVQRYFVSICSALNATRAKNNYRLGKLRSQAPVKALFLREMKRYFASSIYVTNTLMGYVLMPLAGIALLAVGAQKLEALLNLGGVVSKAYPLFLGAIAAIMSTTCCSISMEGKQWWIAQTIPVRAQDIFHSKILVNLVLAFPGYVISVVCGYIAFKPTGLNALWMALIPAVYIVFKAVSGLTINLLTHIFDWENETRVVKQSASTMLDVLVGFASFLPPIFCLLSIANVNADLVMGLTTLVLGLLTFGMYMFNGSRRLSAIG